MTKPWDRMRSSLDDLGADAGVREDFEQERVRKTTVGHVDLRDAVFDGVDAAADLREHAAGEDAGFDQAGYRGGADFGDERGFVLRVAEHAGHVAEEDELAGVERLGDLAGGEVGVDVVGIVVVILKMHKEP